MAIANRLARTVYKILGGDSYKDLGYYRGHMPNEKKIANLCAQLKNMGLDVSYQKKEILVSKTTKVVAETGECLE